MEEVRLERILYVPLNCRSRLPPFYVRSIPVVKNPKSLQRLAQESIAKALPDKQSIDAFHLPQKMKKEVEEVWTNMNEVRKHCYPYRSTTLNTTETDKKDDRSAIQTSRITTPMANTSM